MQITKKDRYLGCFLGGAVGDALGNPIEFWDEDQIRHRYGSSGIQTLAQAGHPAVITDDTQMTLFNINGILYAMTNGQELFPSVWLAHREWLGTQGDTSRMEDPEMPKMWLYRQPLLHVRRAPGITCLTAIQTSETGGTPDKPVNKSKGCGAVMKAAPFGLMRRYDPELYWGDYRNVVYKDALSLGGQTHGHPLGILSAVCLASALAEIVQHHPGEDTRLEDVLLRSCGPFPYPMGTELHTGVRRAIALALDPRTGDLEGIHALGEGWVAEEALYIAVFCAVRYQDDFAAAIRASVNHEGDSDSTGSVCGNLLGAWLGQEAVAQAFDLENLEMADLIREVSTDFYRAVESGIPENDPEWDRKYRYGGETPQPPRSELRKAGLIYTPLTEKALRICFDAHRDQVDKTGLPYVFHPLHLAEQMETEEEICVALMHDVLEDSDYTPEELEQAGFPPSVVNALKCMTHDPAVPYMDYVRVIRKNSLARKVKQADLLHNSDLSRRPLQSRKDKLRWLKYRIALAILEDDWYDWLFCHYQKRIPLDDQRLCFLSVFYKKGGTVEKYSLDIEAANDSHYQFSVEVGEQLRRRLAPDRSLPEALSEYLLDHSPWDFPNLLKEQKLSFLPFHF